MKRWLNYAEIGILAGFFIGLILLGIAWFYSKTADAHFCLFTLGERDVCIRYISLYPFALALAGLIIGIIADRFRKKDDVEIGAGNAKINVEQK